MEKSFAINRIWLIFLNHEMPVLIIAKTTSFKKAATSNLNHEITKLYASILYFGVLVVQSLLLC